MLKRYLLMMGSYQRPLEIGWSCFYGSYSTICEAELSYNDNLYDWYQVIDSESEEIVAEWE